ADLSPKSRARDLNDWIERLEGAAGSEASSALAYMKTQRGLHSERRERFTAAEEDYRAALDLFPSENTRARQFINLRLASLAAERDAYDEASSRLASSGLTANQCSLLDVSPVPVAGDGGSYPVDLLKRGFRGIVSLNYEIDTDGDVREPRVVYAYPPFLFSDSTRKIANGLRYQKIYREGEAIGCSGMRQNFKFQIRG
ncbi:MAG: energy transducer TonB, partial [Pacificimonas sp.]